MKNSLSEQDKIRDNWNLSVTVAKENSQLTETNLSYLFLNKVWAHI